MLKPARKPQGSRERGSSSASAVRHDAEERVAAFLLNLSERFTALGYSPSDFLLRMTREEIGSLLGMKLETVSRIFSRFHKDELIEIEGKHVRIVNSAGLRRTMGH